MEMTLENAIEQIQQKFRGLVSKRMHYDTERMNCLNMSIVPEVTAVALSAREKDYETIEQIVTDYKKIAENEHVATKAYRVLGLAYLATNKQSQGEFALERSFEEAAKQNYELSMYRFLRQKAQNIANCMIEAANEYKPVTGNIKSDVQVLLKYQESLANNKSRQSKIKRLD